MVHLATLEYASTLGALINALVYSLIAWAISVVATKRIGETSTVKQSVKNNKKE
jgi:Co/Zn/Cd efflux system component